MWGVQPFNDVTACHKAHINTISELQQRPAASLPVMQLNFSLSPEEHCICLRAFYGSCAFERVEVIWGNT